MFYLRIFVTLSVAVIGVDAWCSPGSYGSWHAWESCSESCGGGTHSRKKVSCVLSKNKWESEGCNEYCYNDGTYSAAGCHCKPWRSGRCCEDCVDNYYIPHCEDGKSECGGTPDNIRCTSCHVSYYSGGFGHGCLECTKIQDCEHRHCSDAHNVVCDNCYDDNVFYKRTYSSTKCERLCSFDVNKCWPGSCSSELTTSCKCAPGFRRSGVKCLLDSTTKPDIVNCQTIIYGGIGKSGDKKRTPGGTKCVELRDFYGKFQPTMLEFDMTSELTINISFPASINYISESNFGVTDTTVYIKRKPVSGFERLLSTHQQKSDSGKSENVDSTVYNTGVEVSLTRPTYHLTDGERLCIHFEAKGGGYVKGLDFRTNTILDAESYDKTVTTKVICYRYDDSPPQHCLNNNTCIKSLPEPIQIQSRIIRYSMLQVDLDGWFDPIPVGGTPEHASGIESYTITVNEVADGQVSTTKVSETTLNTSQLSVALNLTSMDGKPRLYCLRLEVKDVADNLQQARRFVLYDETTNITTDTNNAFVVTSASTETNHQWQTHHNDVCLDWKNYFYNAFYKANFLLGKIRPDEHIKGIYEQTTGVLPVNGTANVYGITSYVFSWTVDNGSVSTETEVPNFLNQTYCHKLPLKDGQTYVLNIKSTDIVNNTLMENRTIHIDRSAPHINNIGLEKYGIRRLFAHGESDLAKMNISFEVLDPHSGIVNVKWTFGTAETNGILGTGIVPSKTFDERGHCPANVTNCYCPDVGTCEVFKYSISLNKLVNNRTNIGDHNRNYYFTIKATNKAKLINIEHLDIVVDDSPPEKGVVFEGVERTNGSPDIDYTSEDEIIINWHGFIDHESGIKEYRLKLDDKCLNKNDLFQEGKALEEKNYTVVPFSESSIRLTANFTGKKYTSIIAINNAMEPSEVVCSDGITRDRSPPSIKNVRIRQGRWSESIYCKDGQAWLFHSEIKKIPLSATPVCVQRCLSNTPMSEMFVALPTEISGFNDTDITDFLCLNLPLYDKKTVIFLPNDHIFIQWDIYEHGSQMEDCSVGFGVVSTNTSMMSVLDFTSTHSQTYFKVNHLGVGSGENFYAHIKTINKANLEKVTVIGPILIDETPPQVRTKPVTKVEIDTIIVGWENDTFYDLEQAGIIHQLFFEIVHDEMVVSPLLEWRNHDSTTCPGFSGGCFKYPLKRLQKIDTDLGLNFSFNVHAYNNAGHLTKVTTDTFKLPSLYPPGQAIVYDIDPELRDDVDLWKDADLQFTPNTLCACWQGFRHHEKLNIEIGVGTNETSADVVNFEATNSTSLACIHSKNIKSHKRYFFLVRATCTGGITFSSSNGVEIYHETEVIESINLSSLPIKTVHGFDVEFTNSSATRACLNDNIVAGHSYMLIISNTSLNITITSEDVLFKYQTFNASGLEVISGFIAFNERPCFEIDGDNIWLQISESEPKPTEKTFLRYSDEIYTRWKVIYSTIQNKLSFKVAMFEIGNVLSNISGTSVIPFEQSEGHLWHTFTLIPSKLSAEYYIAVIPCTNVRCLSASKSFSFEIESRVRDFNVVEPSIISKGEGCSHVSFAWNQFEAKSGLKMYLWSVSRDKAAHNVLATWRSVAASTVHSYKVNECIQLPIHGQATLFICVRGYSAAGNIITNCQQAVTETQDDSKKDHIYDIDINRDTWHTIKQMIHSSNVGKKYTLIHDSELDFGTSNSSVAGVILYTSERNVTWYLMSSRRLPRYEQCERDRACIRSTTNTQGYVIFENRAIQYNTFYYICAYSVVTYVERELFTETQNELRSCSNGFIIDDTPPSSGTVDVSNKNGYINDMTNIFIAWNGFSDDINAEALGYSSPFKYYSIAMGTRAGGENLKTYTVVGNTKSVTERLTNVLDGTILFVSVKATDQAGLTSVAYSSALVVDTSPPVPGRLTLNGRHRERIFMKKTSCTVEFEGFEDPHSGIKSIEISLGSSEGQSDLMNEKYPDRNTELELPFNLLDGHIYFITAKALNRAGLTSRPVSVKFLMDRSPPSGGHVMDGHRLNKKDVNFQRDLSSIHAHWRYFEDPHSGITIYRVALGTKQYVDDIQPFIDVGILTEHVWNGTFNLGQKYYTTVEACNGAGLCRSRSSNGVLMDNSPPVAGIVLVGTGGKHMKYLPNGASVHIKWLGFDDPQSGIDHYETCIGTSPKQCDIQPFTTCLLQSHIIKTNLNLKAGKSYFVAVKAFNKAGFDVTSSSDEFKIDDTPPVVLRNPSFILNNYSLKEEHVQYERSIFRVTWQFEDNESHIASHIVSLKTHHEGHTPVEHVHVGDVSELTINLDKDNWLNNGDTYFVTVTSCNVAGLCTSASSEQLLVDSTPPHRGGFKPPMNWNNFVNSFRENKSNITLTWYGFFDAESSIDKYYLTISRNYSGQELSNGIVMKKAEHKESEEKTTITIEGHLKPDDEIILTVWAQNFAGLNSTVARITVYILSSGKGSVANMNGILEIQKHSCDVHFCNGDCTCAVIGKPCVETSANVTCTSMFTSEAIISAFPIVHVYGGLPNHPTTISGSSACVSGHWKTPRNEHLIHRYEWSMGLKDQPIGEGIFDLKKEIPWRDSGKLKQAVYCLPRNSGLENDKDYVVYVKAWYASDLYAVFESPPFHTDHTPPHNNKGKTVKDSDVFCNKDYDVIDWMDTVTACWKGVFSEQQGELTYYTLSLGTTINGSDIFPRTNVGLGTDYTLKNLSLSHGTVYYFTVTAYNNVGLHTTLSSDGFVVDMDTPIHGVVFNTDRFVDASFQSSTSTFAMSWHGFIDHYSGIRSYHVAVIEDTINDYTNVSFINVNLTTRFVLGGINLKEGHSYVGLVKGTDAAGHISSIARSNPKTIDTTSPTISTCSDSLLLYSNEHILDNEVSIILNVTENTYYAIEAFINSSVISIIPTLSIDRFKWIVPTTVNDNGSVEFQHYFLSSRSGEVNITILTNGYESMSQNETLIVSVSECRTSLSSVKKQDPLQIRQIGLSKLGVKCLLVDFESSISKVDVGVGTTPSGFQLRHLSPMSTSGVIDVDLVHGTQLYVTLIAYNNADLKSVFTSAPLLIDKTPPFVNNIRTTVTHVNTSTSGVDIDVNWDVDDTESDIKYCLCGLGSMEHLTDLLKYTLSTSVTSCRYQDMQFQHGDHVYVSVKCINSVELSSIPRFKMVSIVLQPPKTDLAKLNVISASPVSMRRQSVSDIGEDKTIWFVQTDASSFKIEWSDFMDRTDIDHYEHRLTWQNNTIADWNVCYSTATEMSGIALVNGRRYTVEVRAVNVGQYTSDSIYADIVLHNDNPRLSGQPIHPERIGHQLKLDWSDVIRLANDLDITYDVTIGTRAGFSDILELNRVDFSKYVFNMPSSTIITQDVSEIFLTITCTYSTGLFTVFTTNYKF